jgi:hypothetical protein
MGSECAAGPSLTLPAGGDRQSERRHFGIAGSDWVLIYIDPELGRNDGAP